MTSMTAPDALIERASAAVDDLAELDFTTLGGEQLLATFRAVAQLRRKVESLDHPLIAEVEARKLPERHGNVPHR